MRRRAWPAALTALSASLTVCAALSGLDQIHEDDCVPAGCEASVEGGFANGDEFADAAFARDTAVRADGPDDEGDASEEADAPGRPETATESDSSVNADDAQRADTGGVDRQEAQAPDAGVDCGSLDDPDHCGSCSIQCATCAGARECSGGACAGGTVYYYEPFTGGATGWLLDATWSAASECASPPAPDKGNADPTSDHTSMTAAGGVIGAYVCGNNPRGQLSPARYATSPAVDVSSAPSLTLTFYRWLNSDEPAYMVSTVDVFDGTAWKNLYTNPPSALVTDAAWTKVEYDVTTYKNAAFRVRFGFASTSTKVYAMSSWNVDDVTLSTASCP
jgi:hypothetical protein